MLHYFKRVIDFIYAFLLPDAVGDYSASFRYKLLVVLVVMFLSSTAAYTIVYFQ